MAWPTLISLTVKGGSAADVCGGLASSANAVRPGGQDAPRNSRPMAPCSLPGEGNLPIETVTALNAKTAKAPALTVPPSMILRADEVIE